MFRKIIAYSTKALLEKTSALMALLSLRTIKENMSQNKPENRIRVLRILSRMNVGGPSRHVVNLTSGLSQIGYHTRLAVGLPESAEGSMLSLAEKMQIRPDIIACFDRPVSAWRDSIAFGEIVRHIRNFRPHIVHTHTTKAGILGRIAAVMCRVPVIFHTFHGHVFTGYFSEKTSRAIICLERLLAKFTDSLITLTPGIKADIFQRLRLTESGKIEVIPLGLDLAKNLGTQRKSSGWRKELGLDEGVFLAGIVARLVPVKNHKMLIEAISVICKKMSNLHLAVVGGGELEAQLKNQVEMLGLKGRVHFCGIVRDIEAVYADLDLLVLSSKNEGTPVVVIEALASGCPVAATRVGGIEEVLDSGRLGMILENSPDSFATGLATAIDSTAKAGSLMTARNEIADKYSVPALVDRMHKLYGRFLRLRGINV